MVGAKLGTWGFTGASCCKGALVPVLKVLGGAVLTARVVPEWSDSKDSLAIFCLAFAPTFCSQGTFLLSVRKAHESHL